MRSPGGARAGSVPLAKQPYRVPKDFLERWLSVRAAMFYEPADVRMEAVPAPEQAMQMVRKGGDVRQGAVRDLLRGRHGVAALLAER
jgi:hypothetical protein